MKIVKRTREQEIRPLKDMEASDLCYEEYADIYFLVTDDVSGNGDIGVVDVSDGCLNYEKPTIKVVKVEAEVLVK